MIWSRHRRHPCWCVGCPRKGTHPFYFEPVGSMKGHHGWVCDICLARLEEAEREINRMRTAYLEGGPAGYMEYLRQTVER